MKTTQQEKVEGLIEGTPYWLKGSYVFLMRIIKHFLALTGMLSQLDKRSQQSQRFHYLRSLLAIHHLEDMIFLDVPWWTYTAISALETHFQRMGSKPVVFEYGSGASTIWLAKRCAQVISIEHDVEWYNGLIGKLTPYPHVQLLLKQPDQGYSGKYGSQKASHASFKSYVEAIKETEQTFDIIVIDGRAREACLSGCLPFLKPNGLIIFDNSNRKRYQQALNACGLEVCRFYGCVPGSPFKSETAFLRKQKIN